MISGTGKKEIINAAFPMNLVINGHGGKTNRKFDVGANILMTPGNLDEPYITSVDPNYNLEQDFLNGKIKPIKDGNWHVYSHEKNQENGVPDVDISPWNNNEAQLFSSSISNKTNLWSEIDGKQGLYIDRDPNSILVIRSNDGGHHYLNQAQSKEYFNNLSQNRATNPAGTPIFFLAPNVGKVKILNRTSLSEVMGCLGELNIENRNIICATCNNKSGNDKNIAIDHKSESVLVSSIIGPIAPKISLASPVQPKPSLQPGVTIYKSTNGELAVKFGSPEARKRFIDALGGPQQFANTNKFNAGKTCPAVYNNNNDTLYIPAYTAQNGELAASFPNNQMRDKFMNLLGMQSAKLATTYPGQDALYIADKNIHQQGANIKLSISMATPQNQTTQQPAPTTGSGFFTAFNNGSNSHQFADFAAKASALDEKLKTAKPESIANAEASAIAQEINEVTNTHKAISSKTNPPFEAKLGKIMNCLESIAKRAQDLGGAIAKAGNKLAKSMGLNISKDKKVQINPKK